MDAPKGDLILIPCEGSRCWPASMLHGVTVGIGMCGMCGQAQKVIAGVVVDHQRDDLIARLKRGDFG